ncbi:DNA-3-methyladenine glycosylase family protein [Methylotenera versatilis]|jgi:DNA-3-methyladenine glycosylase II|uniref:DNA-3-methyladenine glycosylase II n=1 Tax=Methylotenera versatilis (strain 301) TaxID=666681 RepID=D7DP09_METV0|nr:DNA-3-methyladenine glycosylase [Methylotenera versatilis]ADI31040.1 DNA-3-methyladenine glycosylase II [Methylotenera versatilis 301]
MLTSTLHLQQATKFLTNLDADWARLIETVGECQFEPKPAREPYEALIRAVAYQQLHAKAGDAIIKRLLSIYGDAFPAASQLLATDFVNLRACGFSARKIETIQGIAEGAISGLVPTRTEAASMADEDLILRLVTLKGIGRWTVEMLLMFTMARMDVLPADDFGVVQGYKRLKKLKVAPTRKEITEIGKTWSPYRTIASWYLWRVPK